MFETKISPRINLHPINDKIFLWRPEDDKQLIIPEDDMATDFFRKIKLLISTNFTKFYDIF